MMMKMLRRKMMKVEGKKLFRLFVSRKKSFKVLLKLYYYYYLVPLYMMKL